MVDSDLLNVARALPKIDLHRHLEGSVRLETLIDIAREYEIEMPEYDIETLRPFVQMIPGEAHDSRHFLAKFYTIRQFFRSPDVIRRVTQEAVADAAADNVKYLELRFTPRALTSIMGCSYHDVIDLVCQASAQAAREHLIEVRLIVSLNRHESLEIGEQVFQAALDFSRDGIAAIDLAGNEADFSALPFQGLFERAKRAGFGVTIHAGEWGGAQNIRDAIERLYADRIGHGVRVVEDPALMDWLAERGTTLEICPTSNVHSGVVPDWSQHPLPHLFRQQLRTTINTDDPLLSDITLSHEIAYALNDMTLTMDEVKQNILTAARSAFLPDLARSMLVDRFERWLGVA